MTIKLGWAWQRSEHFSNTLMTEIEIYFYIFKFFHSFIRITFFSRSFCRNSRARKLRLQYRSGAALMRYVMVSDAQYLKKSISGLQIE